MAHVLYLSIEMHVMVARATATLTFSDGTCATIQATALRRAKCSGEVGFTRTVRTLCHTALQRNFSPGIMDRNPAVAWLAGVWTPNKKVDSFLSLLAALSSHAVIPANLEIRTPHTHKRKVDDHVKPIDISYRVVALYPIED